MESINHTKRRIIEEVHKESQKRGDQRRDEEDLKRDMRRCKRFVISRHLGSVGRACALLPTHTCCPCSQQNKH